MKNDIATRAGKTFVQAFLAALSVSVTGITDTGTAKVALIAALAAGISAVWNFVILTK